MPIHGIAPTSCFIVAQQDESMACLLLKSSEETKRVIRLIYEFRACVSLVGNCLETSYMVKNTGDKVLPFSLSGHSGFRLPFEGNHCFEDYFLCFGESCEPDRVGFTESCFVRGYDKRFTLEDGRFLPLKHELFDKDAVVLKNIARFVSLCTKDGKCAITVSYPNMPYLGIWHMPHTDAPYVCIEPWLSLPSRQDIIENLYCKSALIRFNAGESYKNTWSISISED